MTDKKNSSLELLAQMLAQMELEKAAKQPSAPKPYLNQTIYVAPSGG